MQGQVSMFDGNHKFVIDKPIRLIELFAGYGSQSFALKYLGIPFEHWKICEWAVKSIQAYKDAHFTDQNQDYSKDYQKTELIEKLFNIGISSNYNEPMTKQQIERLPENKIREIYNNIQITHNLVNIQQVHADQLEIKDTDKYCYIMTYSFPCQDLSLAGKQAGMEKGSGTRSGMLWEVERILDECQDLPQVLVMENVPEVIGTNNIKHFAKWVEKLEQLGYKNKWEVLNGKDFGIPQNRERCFMVSTLGNYYYDFPNTIPLENKLKDLLEDEVDEKYYLSDKAIIGKVTTNFQTSKLESVIPNQIGIMPTICARDYKDPKCIIESDEDKITINGKTYPVTKNNENFIEWKQKGFLDSDCRAWKDDKVSGTLTTNGKNKIAESNLKRKMCNNLIQSGKVKENDVIRHSYSTSRMNGDMKDIQQNNISPTLDTRCDCLGVVVKTATKQGYEIANDGDSINLSFPNSTTRRGRVGNQVAQTLLTNDQIGVVVKSENKRLKSLANKMDLSKDNQFMDIYNQTTSENAGTITTRVDASNSTAVYTGYRIRKLTPKECFRLMGVKDADFENIAKNQSNASLYHLAGDSIIVNVLMAIFQNLT